MIKKEYFKTREDGMRLYRTYSDTDHKIRNKRTSEVYTDATDIAEEEEYEEVEEYVEMEGASTYDEVLAVKESMETDRANTIRKINHLHLTNEEALSVKELYPRWEDKVGNTIEIGYITFYKDNLWRARQTHIPLEIYPPSLATASLYEAIDKEHDGTLEDPIPYNPPMEIFIDKYYIENNEIYKCIRNSDTALSHSLKDLVGIYVNKI